MRGCTVNEPLSMECHDDGRQCVILNSSEIFDDSTDPHTIFSGQDGAMSKSESGQSLVGLVDTIPRCINPIDGDDVFPEQNCENLPAADTEDFMGSTGRVFLRVSGKHFHTLAEAAQDIQAGETVVLAGGAYHETHDVVLRADNVTISAARGPHSSSFTKVIFTSDCGLVCSGKGIMISDVSFIQLRSGSVSEGVEPRKKERSRTVACIRVKGGNAKFENCAFSSESSPGFCISESARPFVTKCTIEGCRKIAILCKNKCNPRFENNVIQNNMGFAISTGDACEGSFVNNIISNTSKCAILCSGSSKPLFENNVVSDGTQGGFWIQGKCKCILKNNVIRNNHKAALQISDNSDPHIQGNTILDGDGGGIVVHGEARGLYIGNKLSGSVRAGIGVMDSACPVFIGNEMHCNQGGGAVMAGQSAPVFIGNTLSGNGFVGMGVKEESTPLLQDNVIVGNVGYGILLQGRSTTVIQNSVVENNKRAGICACEHAFVRATKCVIQASGDGSQRAGLLLHDDSKAVLQQSTLVGHRTGNIVMQDRSTGAFTENELSGAVVGIKLHASASATLRNNIIRDSKECNVLLLNHSQLRASHNTFSGAGGEGLHVVQCAVLSLSHNTVVENHHAGVKVDSAGSVDLRHNRVSNNGGDGVEIVKSRLKMKNNAIFGNEGIGLVIKTVRETPVILGNTILAGDGERSGTLDAENSLVLSMCTDNSLQATKRCISLLMGTSVWEQNKMLPSRALCQAALEKALDAVHSSAPKQTRTLVTLPDGTVALAFGNPRV